MSERERERERKKEKEKERKRKRKVLRGRPLISDSLAPHLYD